MQPIRRGAALLASCALLAPLGAGCGNQNSGSGGGASSGTTIVLGNDKPVATVNGASISQLEFFNQLQNYAPQQPQSVTAGRAIMQQLIVNELIVAMAKQQNVAPTDADLDALYKPFVALQESNSTKPFEQVLQDVGLTPEQVKHDQFRPQLARLKLLTKGLPPITDTEIKAYYDLNKSKEFTRPDRAHIKRIIVATQADAQTAAQEIKKGQQFEMLASRSLSKQPADGDVAQWLPLDATANPTLAPLVSAAKSTSVGATSTPFAFQGYWWLVKVVDKKPKETLTLDQVKGLIPLLLLNKKAQEHPETAAKLDQQLREFQTKADIKVSLPGSQYADMVAVLKNPPPPAPGGVPGAPGLPPGAVPGPGMSAPPGAVPGRP